MSEAIANQTMNRIEVTPEGRPGIYLASKSEVEKFVRGLEQDTIHSFIGSFGMDWSKDSVIQEINKGERLALLTDEAPSSNMGHALAVIVDNELKCFDIGKITEDMLNVTEFALGVGVIYDG